jgi:hypothetical protein
MSDRQSGQLDEWLDLNHWRPIQIVKEIMVLTLTLYKQLAWKRFLQVLQGFCGRLLSMTLIILPRNQHRHYHTDDLAYE